MKFVDVATVEVKAGDGGDGRTSFRQEKFVDRGGPDGGDGGDGGNVVFKASRNQNTLVSFRFHKTLRAEAGQAGGKTRRHGKRGKDLLIEVPVGTVVYENDVELVDFTHDGQTHIIAAGGRGGFGNAHFISSVRQAPKFAEPGGEGEIRDLRLELKLIADVGLIGLPNAGKSTFLSVVSNARPEIADYPFTTLIPNLGVVHIDEANGLLIADIPGLIEGASEGKGLGDEFLRHIERTAVLLHFVDISSQTVIDDYKIIENEIRAYSLIVASRPTLIVFTKTDLVSPQQVDKAKKSLQKYAGKRQIFSISAQAHQGVKELLYATARLVQSERRSALAEESTKGEIEEIPVLTFQNSDTWNVAVKKPGVFMVSGTAIDRFVSRTDFSNEESIARLRDIMRKKGILHDLTRNGAKLGDTIAFKRDSFTL